MSSPWVKSSEPVQQVNLADIMSEQYAHKLHDKEVQRHTESCPAANMAVVQMVPHCVHLYSLGCWVAVWMP